MNEITFEDSQGREEIYIHAEHDRTEKTNHNHTERVDNNWIQSIGGAKASEVQGNRHDSVHGSYHLHVGPTGFSNVANPASRAELFGMKPISYGMNVSGIAEPQTGLYSQHVDNSFYTTVGVETSFTSGRSFRVRSNGICSFSARDSLDLNSGKD